MSFSSSTEMSMKYHWKHRSVIFESTHRRLLPYKQKPAVWNCFFWCYSNLTTVTYNEIREKNSTCLLSLQYCLYTIFFFLTFRPHFNKGGFIIKGSIQLICNKVQLIYFFTITFAPLPAHCLNTCKNKMQCCSFFLDSPESNQHDNCTASVCHRCT